MPALARTFTAATTMSSISSGMVSKGGRSATDPSETVYTGGGRAEPSAGGRSGAPSGRSGR